MAGRRQIQVVEQAQAPAAELYRLLVDGRSWVDWSPLDECVPQGLGASESEQVGTVRANRLGRTRGLDRITELVPDQRFGYEHVKGLPVRDYVASVRLTPSAVGATTITWDVSFVPRWPGTGALLSRGIAAFIGECAHGLAAYAGRREG